MLALIPLKLGLFTDTTVYSKAPQVLWGGGHWLELNKKEGKWLRVLPPLAALLLGRDAPTPTDTLPCNTFLAWEDPLREAGILGAVLVVRVGGGLLDAPSSSWKVKVALETVGRGLRPARASDVLRRRRQPRRAVVTRMEPELLVRKVSVLQVRGGWARHRILPIGNRTGIFKRDEAIAFTHLNACTSPEMATHPQKNAETQGSSHAPHSHHTLMWDQGNGGKGLKQNRQIQSNMLP